MTDDTQTTADNLGTSAPETEPKARRRKRWPVALAILGVIVVVAGVGFLTWHQTPGFCGTVCHTTMGSYLETYENSSYLVANHAAADVVCLDCHEADLTTQLAELQVQLGGDYRLPLAKMETDDGFCLRSGCHTREDIVESMSDYETSLGDKANPHEKTVSAQSSILLDPHSDPSGETIACSTCHTAHRKSSEIDHCFVACHHNQTFESCSNCHDSIS
ncbi:MAG: hypothetical protein FWG23_06980 [Eggerthellaceae bacterium]|nr:hypothetical protein [Eggerthellaceae bacterium]MDR2715656.1 hypothetical protein [Coriobacteriaceae bacterium]